MQNIKYFISSPSPLQTIFGSFAFDKDLQLIFNQSCCRNDATPRQCAVVRLETKYFIHAVNILDSPAPCDVTDDVILTGSLTINHQWSNCVNKLKRTMHYSILTFHFLQILNHHRYQPTICAENVILCRKLLALFFCE